MRDCSVRFQIYDWDRFGRNNPIGEVIQRLEDVDLQVGETGLIKLVEWSVCCI